MKQLSNKREAFCRYIAIDGLTASDSYRKAFDTDPINQASIHEQSSKLLKVDKVTTRIKELKEAVTEKMSLTEAWTRDKYLSELQINLDGSRNSGAWPAANGSLQMIGKVTGHLNDKVTVESSLEATVNVIHKLPDAVLAQLAAMSGQESVASIDTGSEAAIVEANYSVIEPETEP